jgi:hypothetical protein
MENSQVKLRSHDQGAFMNLYQFVWIALAHEKFQLWEGALRFCDLGVETEETKAANPHMWARCLAYATKGRILTKLNRITEAKAMFTAGLECAKGTYRMFECLILREYIECIGDIVDHDRSAELAAKLKQFDGLLSPEQFARLKIGV